MRRWTLAILLLLAGPGFASAACETVFGVGNWVGCAVNASDGSIECWGTDHFDLLTDVPAITGVLSIDGGDDSVCVVESDTSLFCWGCNGCTVVTSMPAGTGYEFVTPGTASEACALKTDNSIECWGSNVVSFDVAPPGSSFDQINGDAGTFCGVLTTGALSCWGFDFATGVMTEPAGTDYAKADATSEHACALKDDQSIVCWGSNTDGKATAPGGTFLDVAVADTISCGVQTDGDLECWGSDAQGIVTGEPAGEWVAVKCSTATCCAADTSGDIACWGSDTTGIVTGSSGAQCADVASSARVVVFGGM